MSTSKDGAARVRARRCVAATLSLVSLVLVSVPAQAVARAAAGAAALSWRDMSGRSYGARDVSGSAATAFIFGSTTCPCADGYNSRIADVARDYAGSGVGVFLVFSAPGVERSAVSRYVESRRISLPAVYDAGGRLAKRLGAKATPAAVVVDSRGAVKYRGRIDDNPDAQAVVRQDLRAALDDLLAKTPVRVAKTAVVGCNLAGNQAGKGGAGRPKLVDGIGAVTFPVATRSPEAQKYFNQGINRWFGFNFPEAEASFKEAARLDPRCAMAHWGVALSLGMNYNAGFDPSRLPEATAAAQKAKELAAGASAKERALIQALAIRHAPGTEQAKQLEAYHTAMSGVYLEYPEDVNVAVLYAASGMDLRPWKLWTPAGAPEPGTMAVLLALEDAMRRDPNHIGVNHYYIHATEASPFPERALKCTGRLAAQAPGSGHLVHMPSHTYLRVGDYRASVASNVRAAEVDAAYYAETGKPTAYGGYYIHNLDFIVASLLFEGRSKESIQAARELSTVAARWTPDFASLFCGSGSSIMTVYSRFGMWDEILKAPAAAETNPFSAIPWRYARGMALTARKDLPGAARELAALEALLPVGEKAAEGVPIPGFPDGLKHAWRTARLHLAGKIAAAKGATDEAANLYRQAIENEDAIPYVEPPLWRHPVRESLGALLLAQGKATESEQVFRDALKAHRRSGRALFGLSASLERQGKREEAAKARAEFNEAWKRADVTLSLAGL